MRAARSDQVTIRVGYFGTVTKIVDRPEELVTLAKGAPVRELLAELVERHGDRLGSALLGPDGTPLPNVVITLDGREIAHHRGIATPIDDDASVRIVLMPAFAGGG